MSLQNKFGIHADWRRYEEIRKQAPQAEIHAVIETSAMVQQWPGDVSCNMHLPQENGRHIYTIRATNTQHFEEFCSQPNVLRLAL